MPRVALGERLAVVETKVDNIQEDVKEIKADVKALRNGTRQRVTLPLSGGVGGGLVIIAVLVARLLGIEV